MNFLGFRNSKRFIFKQRYSTKVSANGNHSDYLPSAAEIWHSRHNPPKEQKPESDSILSVPGYTPVKPDLSIGKLVFPLHYPEYDQKTPSAQASGLASPPNWWEVPLDSPEDPIGNYPRLKMQWTSLRDPFKYWDQQGRRNYGEVLYDQDNFTNEFGVGPEVHWKTPLFTILSTFGSIFFVAFLISLWDPKKNSPFSERVYPYDGLRVELGGDPNDTSDNWMAAVSILL